MITIRKSEDRGHANYGWLDTHHTFSFADYYDPKHMHFRTLRVINEDRVNGGTGFDMHPHRDMEIVTYIVSGTLEHKDSMGSRGRISAGEVQRISAGTGILHSEYNASPEEPVHLLQIWIMPDEKGVRPQYEQKSFGSVEHGKLRLVVSKRGRDGSIAIHQDADIYVARLDKGNAVEHRLAPARGCWVQLIEGEMDANGQAIKAGDGAAVEDVDLLRLSATRDAHFLLFDLP